MTFWDAVAPLYDTFECLNKAYRQMVNKVRAIVPNGVNVLELASGTGTISVAVSGKAARVLCSDISENMLQAAKRKAKKHNAENINFEKISIFETRIQDKAFDVVIASQILHLLEDSQKACEEIRRISKRMAIISIPLLKESTVWGRFLIGIYKLLGFRPKHDFDRDSCKDFLEKMGFHDCEYDTISGTVSLCIAVWRCNEGKRRY